MPAVLQRTLDIIEAGRRQDLHLGAQLCVWLEGELVADLAVGESHPGVPNDRDRMVIWWSMTKAVTAVAVAQLWERGSLDIDAPVAAYLPAFGAAGKGGITIRHCLTHTGGFRTAELALSQATDADQWLAESVAGICAAAPEPGWAPGRKAGYHPGASMMILGEVVRLVDGRPFARYVRDEIFEPLAMPDCWVGMPLEVARNYVASGRVGTMYDTSGPEPRPRDELDRVRALTFCSPAGSGRGPMHQLVRLYRMLLGGGALDGVRVLAPTTVAAITARHRVGMFDKSFRVNVDWGLGFVVDGSATGRHSSPRAFGHGGAGSGQAFADPEFRLAAAIQFNGMPGGDLHNARIWKVTNALYEDLGLAWTGRDKHLATDGAQITA